MADPHEPELEALQPLIEYYARQMGELSGRLAVALSFLRDLQSGHAWTAYPAEVQRGVTDSAALVASVLRMVAGAQAKANDESATIAVASIRTILDGFDNNR